MSCVFLLSNTITSPTVRNGCLLAAESTLIVPAFIFSYTAIATVLIVIGVGSTDALLGMLAPAMKKPITHENRLNICFFPFLLLRTTIFYEKDNHAMKIWLMTSF